MKPFAIIGGGPSLTQADVDMLRDRCFVIAVNDAYRMAPWADVLYACDQKWWTWHKGVPGFTGLKFGLVVPQDPITWAGVKLLRNTGVYGLERDPDGVRIGFNGGYQALNLAFHLNAKHVLLLGFDMCRDGDRTHWFGDHPDGRVQDFTFDMMRQAFVTPHLDPFGKLLGESMADELATLGVSVVNCSRRTELAAFPIVRLEHALERMAA